jgi:hypothetical protein
MVGPNILTTDIIHLSKLGLNPGAAYAVSAKPVR